MRQKELYAAPETEVLELKIDATILVASNEALTTDAEGIWGD